MWYKIFLTLCVMRSIGVQAVSPLGYQKNRALTKQEQVAARVILQEPQEPPKNSSKKAEPSVAFSALAKELNRISAAITQETKRIDLSKNQLAQFVPFDEQIVAVDAQYAQQEAMLSNTEKDELDVLYRSTTQILANAAMSMAISAIKKVQDRIVEHVSDVRSHIIGAGSAQSMLEQLPADTQDFAALQSDIDDVITLCNDAVTQKNNLLFTPEVYAAARDDLKQECQRLLAQLLSDNQTETRSLFAIVRIWHVYFFDTFKPTIKAIEPILAQQVVQLLQDMVVDGIVAPSLGLWQLMILLATTTDTFAALTALDTQKGSLMLRDIENMLESASQKKAAQQTSKDSKRTELLAQSKKQLLLYKRTMNENAFALWQRELERIIEPLTQYDRRAAEQIRALIAERKQEWMRYQKPAGFESQHIKKQIQATHAKEVTAFLAQLQSIAQKLSGVAKNINQTSEQIVDYTPYDTQLYDFFTAYQKIEPDLSDAQVEQVAAAYRDVSVQLSTQVIEQAAQTAARVVSLIQQQMADLKKMSARSAQEQRAFFDAYQAQITASADQIKKIADLVRAGVLQPNNLPFSASVMQHTTVDQQKKLVQAVQNIVDAQDTKKESLSQLLVSWHRYSTVNFLQALQGLPLVKQNTYKKSVGVTINDSIVEPLAALIIELSDAAQAAQMDILQDVLQTDTLYTQLLEIEQALVQQSAAQKTLDALGDLVDQELQEFTRALDRLLKEAYPANQSSLDAWRQKTQKPLAQLKALDSVVADNYQQRIDHYYKKVTRIVAPTVVIKPSLK